MLRRPPIASATTPKAMPAVMPAACTSDSRKPASTSVMPRARCSSPMAGGSLPTCSAAHTPAAKTSQAWRVRLVGFIAAQCARAAA